MYFQLRDYNIFKKVYEYVNLNENDVYFVVYDTKYKILLLKKCEIINIKNAVVKVNVTSYESQSFDGEYFYEVLTINKDVEFNDRRAKIYISCPNYVNVGYKFFVYVNICDMMESVKSGSFKINYDSNVIRYESNRIGEYLYDPDCNSIEENKVEYNVIDNINEIIVNFDIYEKYKEVNGSFELMRIVFNAINSGINSISVTNCNLYDDNDNLIAMDIFDNYVSSNIYQYQIKYKSKSFFGGIVNFSKTVNIK